MKCLCKRRGQAIQNKIKFLKKGEENNKNTEDQKVKKRATNRRQKMDRNSSILTIFIDKLRNCTE